MLAYLKSRMTIDYHPFERLILDHGQEWIGKPLKPKAKKKKAKACFQNSLELALWDTNFTYCEGFALSKSLAIPIHHAWVLEAGVVQDYTWNHEDTVYFGCAFKTEFVREIVVDTRHWCSMFECPPLKYRPAMLGYELHDWLEVVRCHTSEL